MKRGLSSGVQGWPTTLRMVDLVGGGCGARVQRAGGGTRRGIEEGEEEEGKEEGEEEGEEEEEEVEEGRFSRISRWRASISSLISTSMVDKVANMMDMASRRFS